MPETVLKLARWTSEDAVFFGAGIISEIKTNPSVKDPGSKESK